MESNNQDAHKSMKTKQLFATLRGLRVTIKNHGLLQTEIKHYLNILIPGTSVLTDGIAPCNAVNIMTGSVQLLYVSTQKQPNCKK